jgi:metallo-beta-lactamase family protein
MCNNENPFGMGNLTYIASADESKKLNDRHEPMIIISASGMCEGGRIRHHLKNNIGDAKNLVLFIGYCAEGTLGNMITRAKRREHFRRTLHSPRENGFTRHLFRPRGQK